MKKYLIVDTNAPLRFSIAHSDGLDELNWVDVGQTTNLLPEIRSSGLQFEELDAVILVQGDGSFSNTRAGVVLANMFSTFKHIPIIELQNLNELNSVESKEEVEHVESNYNGEPNIT